MNPSTHPTAAIRVVPPHTAAWSVPDAVRVLVVALPLSAWGLVRLIESQPSPLCSVGVVASVGEAVEQLPALRPDVVLVDLDGEEGAETLTALQAQTSAKVLVVTSSSHTALHDRAVLAGARGVVAKREAPDVLLRALVKVHAGEVWIDRSATGRIFQELSRQKAQRPEDPAQARLALLTARERQMVAALAADAAAPGKVLAQRMQISENTLRNHLTSIYSKLQVSNRVELYAFAHRLGLAAEA